MTAEERQAWKVIQGVIEHVTDLDQNDHIPGNSMKATKLLMSLSGQLPGYRGDINRARAVLNGEGAHAL